VSEGRHRPGPERQRALRRGVVRRALQRRRQQAVLRHRQQEPVDLRIRRRKPQARPPASRGAAGPRGSGRACVCPQRALVFQQELTRAQLSRVPISSVSIYIGYGWFQLKRTTNNWCAEPAPSPAPGPGPARAERVPVGCELCNVGCQCARGGEPSIWPAHMQQSAP